jgi:hypothetical protein
MLFQGFVLFFALSCELRHRLDRWTNLTDPNHFVVAQCYSRTKVEPGRTRLVAVSEAASSMKALQDPRGSRTDMIKLTYRYYVGLLSFLNEEYHQVRILVFDTPIPPT